MAYASVRGPWWSERGDLQAGVIASTIAAAHGSRGAKPADFLLWKGRPSKRALADKIRGWAKAMMGGK